MKFYNNTVFKYRCDPVPYTCCRRGARYGFRYFKRPHTMEERRASFLTEEEIYYGVKIRGRRSFRNIPNAWDDRIRADIDIRNWKRYRRTQYKIS